jgi:TonB family protein
MKYFFYAAVGFLLLCAFQAPVSAQSGRKKSTLKVVVPLPPPEPPKQNSGAAATNDKLSLCEAKGLTITLPGKAEEAVFSGQEVTQKAVIKERPLPGYTRNARRNAVKGKVTLRVILASNGEIAGVTVVVGLPEGLTEEAMKAAHRIKFEPAVKDGRAVSQYVCVTYNFQTY